VAGGAFGHPGHGAASCARDTARRRYGTFSDFESYSFELVAAEAIGDLAYPVAYEHSQTSVNGEPRTYTLRATQIYRREGGEWKVVHRHGDSPPPAAATP
jgi:ketosteroid isomerase-like protein